MAKVIVVFGATGMQGGGVAQGLLKNKNFEVRAVTRNPQSDKAKALEKQGAKLVEGNLNDPESLANILPGSHGVFLVTSFYELRDSNKELQQGKNVVDACKAAGVKHMIFSGVDDVTSITGKACPSADSKFAIENYMFASGVPSTAVRYPFYADNYLDPSKVMAKKDDKGTFVIGLPMEGKKQDLLSISSAGNAVAAIFAAPDTYIGKTVGLNGDRKTIPECAEILCKHLAPKTFKAGEVTAEQLGNFGFPGAGRVEALFTFFQRDDLIYNVEFTKQLDPSNMSFEDWVKANKDALNAAYQ
ncbi:nmrA-like family domain-containing protein 1 [Amphiura filiformis]|uniref:nmrA-like family domain-containing protein 1 n=1 Tax=Amphiura filiformis TaxID=82378 RepID=UPI003B20C1D0